eukprot:1646242-Pleurochrysis_carterae.AAC.1
MLEPHRERVAAYLDYIACPLDVRAKGSRNPEQKWFSAATVDDFVLGNSLSSNSKSPGLSLNIRALIEQVFDQHLSTRAAAGGGGGGGGSSSGGGGSSGAARAA